MHFAQTLSLGALVLAHLATASYGSKYASRPRFLNSTSKSFTGIATSFITTSVLATEVSSERLTTSLSLTLTHPNPVSSDVSRVAPSEPTSQHSSSKQKIYATSQSQIIPTFTYSETFKTIKVSSKHYTSPITHNSLSEAPASSTVVSLGRPITSTYRESASSLPLVSIHLSTSLVWTSYSTATSHHINTSNGNLDKFTSIEVVPSDTTVDHTLPIQGKVQIKSESSVFFGPITESTLNASGIRTVSSVKSSIVLITATSSSPVQSSLSITEAPNTADPAPTPTSSVGSQYTGAANDLFGSSVDNRSAAQKGQTAGIALGMVGFSAAVVMGIFVLFRRYKKRYARVRSFSHSNSSLDFQCIGQGAMTPYPKSTYQGIKQE